MKRKIYNKLLDWKNNGDKPLVILGARQVGKTFIVNEFCDNEFDHVARLNLLNDTEIVNLYNEKINAEDKFLQLKLYLDNNFESDNTILFVDEVQESEKFISDLKFLNENYPNIKVICTGSLLGVKLNRFSSSFPVGKVNLINMYPMDFEEFLLALGKDNIIKHIKKCFLNNASVGPLIHEKCINYYKIYTICGGMPESVKDMIDCNLDVSKYNKNILEEIIESYFNDFKKYCSSTDSLKNKEIYKSISFQIANESKKFQYSKISEGAKKRDYELSIDWLLSSNVIIKSSCVKIPQIPPRAFAMPDIFKLFINDVGILTNLLSVKYYDVMNDNLSMFKGSITENYVASQFAFNNIDLFYWKNNYTSEVDFLIYNKDGIIPVEVKSANNTQSKSLKVYKKTYDPKYCIRISLKDFGYDMESKVKSIPLYAVFVLAEDE